MGEIFVICTRSEGGRFLRDATTSPEILNDKLNAIFREWTGEGWNNIKTQFPDRDERDAAPLLSVTRFKDNANGWRVVEVYYIKE